MITFITVVSTDYGDVTFDGDLLTILAGKSADEFIKAVTEHKKAEYLSGPDGAH